MKIQTTDQRLETVREMIRKTLDFIDLAEEFEDENDWGGVKVTLDDLLAIERLIRAEAIFGITYEEMCKIRHADHDEKEELLMIFSMEGMATFIRKLLLPKIRYLLKVLEGWGFCTELGEEFKDYICENLKSLIQQYEFLSGV